MKKLILIPLIAANLCGCSIWSSSSSSIDSSVPPSLGTPVTTPANGKVDFVWVEPMVEQVDVPPSLDPEGTYYRKGHKEVIEIRQGRYQYLDK